MDLGEDNELDFEEDSGENESFVTGSQRKNSSRNSNLSESDDQYLQIDCSEEEETFFSCRTASEGDVPAETDNTKKEPNTQTANYNCEANNGNKGVTAITDKIKIPSKPFKPHSGIKEKIFEDRRPNVRALPNMSNTPKFSSCINQPKSLNGGFYQNKGPLIPVFQPERNLQPLMTVKTKVSPFDSSSFLSPIVSGAERQSLTRRRNKPFSSKFFGSSFSKNNSTYPIENKRMIFSKKVKGKNSESKFNASSESMKKSSPRSCRRRSLPDRNLRLPGSDVKFMEYEFLRRNENIDLDIQCNILKDDERKLLSLKKEARLKRFSREILIKKEKAPIDSILKEKYRRCFLFEDEYFQKMADQKRIREKFLILKGQRRKSTHFESDQNASLEKPNISKESLLKKKNPFEESSEASKHIPLIKIKKEYGRGKEIKEECLGDSVFTSSKTHLQLMKSDGILSTTLSASGQNFANAETERKTPKKYIRTVSEDFSELAFNERVMDVNVNRNFPLSHQIQTFPAMERNVTNSLIHTFPDQIESQLNGSIVKVLNIPPSTTINDILTLCCSIGVVREVKLNFPKENSAVIRFVEPAGADKFFSLYHGQKMENYFLNVIII